MNISKKNQYVILLLIVILFVSLSFSIILNMSFREGLSEDDGDTPDTNADSSPTDANADSNPIDTDTKETVENPLQKKDAQNIQKQCVGSFMNNISTLMKKKYNYQVIYDEIQQKQKKHKNPNQTELNAYFTDPSSITTQDVMDKLSDSISLIRNNPVFKAKMNASTIINYITKYKTDREIPSFDIKQKYDEYISCIETQLNLIANRNKNFYVDPDLNDLIKQAKTNPIYYGLNSTFHKLRLYIKAGIENKLNTD